ncbi:uncharacterized protein LOC135109367 [Scylla paramamosain]|uniref:uncharacterized protein LOC135109367 n=1 Tax=Scylla paramamosain TaxID=85552 RepID=UPI003082E9A5
MLSFTLRSSSPKPSSPDSKSHLAPHFRPISWRSTRRPSLSLPTVPPPDLPHFTNPPVIHEYLVPALVTTQRRSLSTPPSSRHSPRRSSSIHISIPHDYPTTPPPTPLT